MKDKLAVYRTTLSLCSIKTNSRVPNLSSKGDSYSTGMEVPCLQNSKDGGKEGQCDYSQ
jgi:hypothetical protein